MAAAAALRIGVIGGSIAGCAAAVAGSRAGADVTVYERSGAELQDRGFGIVIPPPLHRELVASGYLDARMETAPVATRVWLTREPGGRSARELARQSSPVTPCNWGLLWRSLRASAGAGAVRYLRGEPVTSVGEGPDGRAVVTTARGAERYDIVVGADGHASHTRQLLAPGLTPEPAGYLVWRGAIPLSALADHPRELELLRGAWVTLGFPGGHGIFYLIPGAGDRSLAYAIYGRPPAASSADADPGPYVRELAKEHFPAAWAEIVGHGTHRTTACHPVADVQVPRAARAPLLLAGDAAGVSRPHTASGAVKALQDALCLERVLREGPTPAAALERYADERTAAGAHLVALGRRMGRAQVEETPDWAAMGQEEVDVWFRGVLAGTRHYLYEQPGAGVTA
ncbi:FAD-dependent monooxygenase [Streptomyces cyaneofuscatus]|uniref:FAD-dependent monooxygenase n=1 Tax=Streptomyces TaxID=1883 RepID=UPI001AF81D30|nr:MULTISPECIES: FAD-dependent monooxygenase [unclassified Streptomyces]CAD5929119.1 2,6-dihydroxypyridine 3-monooxygenase [Streptomyces sp. KY70]CAD5989344.1 2,6-dihydroxypyridine 3-monooxygenase [Streptomyces sp. KY75]